KNHFAGWMLMAVPVTLGYLSATIVRRMRGIQPDWRSRLLWLSSPEASKTILVAVAAAVMALSLMLTMSRSAIGAFAVTLAVIGWLAVRRFRNPRQRLVVLGYLAVLSVFLLSVVGVDVVFAHFRDPTWTGVIGRSGAWSDAISTFRRHWIT